jgi:hypothetical protein
MSAAATAAGYLYASGRLRGRAGREQEQGHEHDAQPEQKPARREQIRVALLPAAGDKPRRTPKIEYRTRKRWTAE